MNVLKRVMSALLCMAMLCGVLYVGAHQSSMQEQALFEKKDSVILWYTDESMTDYLSAMAVAYQEEYGIRVIPSLQSGSDYLESMYEASVDGSSVPDIYIVSNEALEKAYLSGLASEITDPQELVNTKNFPQVALDAVSYDGKIVGYPYYFETSALLYNKTYLYDMAKNLVEAQESMDKLEEEQAEESAEAKTEETAEDVNLSQDEKIQKQMQDLIPTTFEQLLSLADEYDAPAAVEAVFKWDVTDIFYNYFFVGNYLNVGGPCGDDAGQIDIYNQEAIDAMQVYQDLNQFFSIEAEDVNYASVVQEFIEGKLVLTTATADVIKKLEEAKENGEFTFEYGLTEIPDLNDEMQTKSMSVTNTVVINSFGDQLEDANDFATYLTCNHSGSLYEKVGKIPSWEAAACQREDTAVFFREYTGSVPVPKLMVTSNFWVELEVAFAQVWRGEKVTNSLYELSELIMSQVTGEEYTEEYIEQEEEDTREYFDEDAEREAAKAETETESESKEE